MKRKFSTYSITDFQNFKTKMLGYLQLSGIFCFLDNHQYNFNKRYDCLAACGAVKILSSSTSTTKFTKTGFFENAGQDWIFGHISYDIKNEFEDVYSANFDGIQFPVYYFFVPAIVFILNENNVQIGVNENENTQKIFDTITSFIVPEKIHGPLVHLNKRFTKEEYITTVNKLQQHIHRGNCYEINFCQEFFAADVLIDPLQVYKKLCLLSPNPFSAFYKMGDTYLLSASPERFLKKNGQHIISQPIKGTAKRDQDKEKDELIKYQLMNSEKERAENIMIVDMVRNDLSKICEEGSVTVKDFLKIFSFPQVHQMISTVMGTLKKEVSFPDIIAAAFPMASMTGAPKKKVMELIESYEKTRRGLFSGTVGYINPEGDFDWNVVIRSILYNKKNKYISIQAGSAITGKSSAEDEYEECMLKIKATKQALE